MVSCVRGPPPAPSSVRSIGDNTLPIWLWLDYVAHLPGYIQLNLRALCRHAPLSSFTVYRVNRSSVLSLLPDLPLEFMRLPFQAAMADAVRVALLARYGGLYLDSDFLIAQSLTPIISMLRNVDIVASSGMLKSTDKACESGRFSANFWAARRGNALVVAAWRLVLAKMRQRCLLGNRIGRYPNTSSPMSACCHDFMTGNILDVCRVKNYESLGEQLLHDLAIDLVQRRAIRIRCFSGNLSFSPHVFSSDADYRGAPGSSRRQLSIGRFQLGMQPLLMRSNEQMLSQQMLQVAPWIPRLEWSPVLCHQAGQSLLCDQPGVGTVELMNFFGRLAYHQFASQNKRLQALTEADWLHLAFECDDRISFVMAMLYRHALGVQRPAARGIAWKPRTAEALPQGFAVRNSSTSPRSPSMIASASIHRRGTRRQARPAACADGVPAPR